MKKNISLFRNAEKELDRIAALKKLATEISTDTRSLELWETLGLLPTKNERSNLIFEMRIPHNPDATWPLASGLLYDNEQDVIGNTINCLTFSKRRALGHRLLPLYKSNDTPQRVLYCLARYIEESIDRRFGHFIAPNIGFEVSDAFLSRSFNALFKLGLRDSAAIKVAFELVSSHIHATNMDRKSAVSAVLYLCFSGDKTEIEALAQIRDKMAIPELCRLLNWGLTEIYSVGSHDFSEDDALIFFQRALNHPEPNFSGYGCFSDANLVAGLQKFLNTQNITALSNLTRTILALGNTACIDALAIHPQFGITEIIKNNSIDAIEIWKTYLPIYSQEFLNSTQNPGNYLIWNHIGIDLLVTTCNYQDFFIDNAKKWDTLFQQLLKSNYPQAINLLCGKLMILEKTLLNDATINIQDSLAIIIKQIQNLSKPTTPKNNQRNINYEDCLWGVVINSHLPPEFISNILSATDVPNNKWIHTAIAINSMNKFDKEFIYQICIDNLNIPLQDINCSQNEYIDYINSILLTLLFTLKCNTENIDEKLATIYEASQKIQHILDALNSHSETGNIEENEEESADWTGHIAVDKPVLRWNAILQICNTLNLSTDKQKEFEPVLKESIRVAPHVDKRWVIRALVKLNTDDAIKTILYQAFQHIDTELVSHTIRELLPSTHTRAQQALIRCVGRNTVAEELKLLILEEISSDNPEEILRELRALELLRLPQHIDDAIRDAVGRVAALIDATTSSEINVNPSTIEDVENIIAKLIPNSDMLSLDTRSALRTAEMILIQSQEWGTDAVDLSPIVNMHCKAVELALRETLEPWTDALMRKGILSRKLDILGYARPIPEKMQIFEDFLASLPIIKTIPYFSRFKLRKMLRAICLYRPGKRFTLDGPKAFALLLLTASRQKCAFGLSTMLDVGFTTDNELFEFIKLMHSLQDSRNRAVHEGLTWEAKDDIDSMRSQAYRIIHQITLMDDYLRNNLSETNDSDKAIGEGA